MAHEARRRHLVIALGSLAAAVGFWRTAWWRPLATGFGDWQQFQHQWQAGYVAIMRFGEFPLWNPFHCGGVMLFGDPQAQVYGPFFPLALVLGPTLTLKVFLTLHAAVGFAGMYVFAERELKCRPGAAAFASLLWAGSGFFAWHGSGGHSAFLPFYFTPWILLAWRRAAADPRYAAALAALMALTVFEGGVYPFPFFCILLAFDGIVRLVAGENRAGIVLAGALTIPTMLLLGAFRILPTLDTLRRYPRKMDEKDFLSVGEIGDILTARSHSRVFTGHRYVWDEYGTYIGWAGVVVIVLGFIWLVSRRRWGLVAGFILFGGFMMGRVTPFHPWSLLHALPVFDSLRVPVRFAGLFTFYAALGAAGFCDEAVARLSSLAPVLRRPRTVHVLFGLLVTFFAADLMLTHEPVLDRWEYRRVAKLNKDARYYLTPRSQYGSYASFPTMGVGSTGCYTGMRYFSASGLWTGRRKQVRIQGRGEASHYRRTTNSVAVHVKLPKPGRVVFNQTYAAGWTSSVGKLQADEGGLAVVDLPAGKHKVVLRYAPPEFWRGAVLSMLGVVLALLIALFATPARVDAVARRPRPTV